MTYKGTNFTYEGSTLMTSSNLNYFPKDPTPYIVICRVGFQDTNFEGDTRSVHNDFQ